MGIEANMKRKAPGGWAGPITPVRPVTKPAQPANKAAKAAAKVSGIRPGVKVTGLTRGAIPAFKKAKVQAPEPEEEEVEEEEEAADEEEEAAEEEEENEDEDEAEAEEEAEAEAEEELAEPEEEEAEPEEEEAEAEEAADEEDAEAEEEEAEAEEEDEEAGQRYKGQLKLGKGKIKFTIECSEVTELHGEDAKVTFKSSPPAGLKKGEWISFVCTEDTDGTPLAVMIEKCAAPDEEQEEEEEPVEAEVTASGISKSSAVAKFRKALATGKSFSGGFANPAKGASPGGGLVSPFAGLGGKGGGNAALFKSKPGKKKFQRVFLERPKSLSKADKKAIEGMRKELEITVEGDKGDAFPPIVAFEELVGILPEYVLETLTEQGFEAPMPVQAQCMPLVLGGCDLIGIAKTGSGKTLAYLLPAMAHIEAQEPVERGTSAPICLILAPVRELAVQIADEAKKLLGRSDEGNHPEGIGAVAVFGGGSSNKGWQIQALREGPHIVAATPGRLVDLMEHGDIRMSRVTYLVLDEADRMLEEGFETQVGQICSQVRSDRQTLFFSATWPQAVKNLAAKMCQNKDEPARVTVGQSKHGIPTTREDIVQEVVVFDQPSWEVRDRAKTELLYAHLYEILSVEEHKVLVFVSRKTLADELCNRLWEEGFKTHSMHGGRSQDSRLNILDGFKGGEYKLLVTTDVMGRGLDIPDISHVVVFDMGDIEDYVHRIGRTARGPYGKGHALTFFEYDRKWPHLAGQLVDVMNRAGQEVPEDLVRIAKEVQMGKRSGKWM